MSLQWIAYGENMRLGQGFNSYVQETRVNEAVLITKTRKAKATATAISRPTSQVSNYQDAVASRSPVIEDKPASSPVEAVSVALNPPPISKSDVSGAVTRLRQNGLLDKDTSAVLLSLVGSDPAPVDKKADSKEPPAVVVSALKGGPDEEDEDEDEKIAAGLCGLFNWARSSKDSSAQKASKTKQAAATKDADTAPPIAPFPCNLTVEAPRNQRVTFTSKEVTEQKDVRKILGGSAAASIKSGNLGGEAGGSYNCEAELEAADMSFVVHVRVINESADYDESLEFKPIENMGEWLKDVAQKGKPKTTPAIEFTKIYGDCFISDFTTGGDLFAIVHITTHDKQNKNAVRLHATAQLSPPASPVNVGAAVKGSSDSSSAFNDAELSINLIWRGGGEVKMPNVNWDIPTLMRVANAFPTLVSRSHAKVGAILMPYTSLRSYQEWCMGAGLGNLRPDYSHCGPYAEVLDAEYRDYGSIAETLDAIVASPADYRSGAVKKTGTPITTAPPPDVKQRDFAQVPEREFRPRTFSEAARQATWGAEADDEGDEDDFDPEASDPLPLSPEVLRAARLYCVKAMSVIQRRVQEIARDPSVPEEFVDYTCPARFRRRLPHHKYSDAGVAFVYDDKDPMIPAEVAVSRSLFYADKLGDEMSKHRKCENFAIGNLTIKQQRRDIYDIKIHPYKHRGLLSRSKMARSYENAVAGISFVYCNRANPDTSFATTMRYPTKIDTVGRGDPGKLPNPAAEDKLKMQSKKQMEAKFNEITPKKLAPLDIQLVEVFWEPGAGYIAGLAFYDGKGVQQSAISHFQWGAKKEPVPETMVCKPFYFEASQPFAGLVGCFECVPGWGGNKVLARCAVVYGVPDGAAD